jgi:hypothetical protein
MVRPTGRWILACRAGRYTRAGKARAFRAARRFCAVGLAEGPSSSGLVGRVDEGDPIEGLAPLGAAGRQAGVLNLADWAVEHRDRIVVVDGFCRRREQLAGSSNSVGRRRYLRSRDSGYQYST